MNVRHAAPFVLATALATASAQDAAETLLRSLSLEQKAGQLFVVWSLSRCEGKAGETNHDKLRAAVRDAGLGGVILSLGTVEDAATLIPTLQAEARVPLLLAGDFEGGVWFRLSGATELGNQMLLGATGSAELAEAAGRVTAKEAKALGFHWVFAPVLDVNSNPANPIINVRSFGEDPQLVAKLGCAFARGVRAEGLIACGKHFPGHGDVDTDSHLALPTVPGDGAQLRKRELVPFAAAAKEGLESVMTGHLAVPGLGEDPAVPATLSHRILHDVLRTELGFTGLVVTDALDMGGVKGKLPPGEVAVKALLAGADVLLMPPDPLAARAAVVEAVKAGTVPMERLDDAVLRILKMKERVGLLSGGGKVAANWREQMRTKDAEAVADAIAARGLTLVRDRDVQPLPHASGPETALVTLMDQDEGQGRVFAAALADLGAEEQRLSAASKPEDVAKVAAKVAAAKSVVLSLHVKVRSYSGQLGLPPALQPVLDALKDEQRVVAVSFGSPYLVARMPAADTFLAAFVSTERVERMAAGALLGYRHGIGRLPVAIPGVALAGAGLSRYPASHARQLPMGGTDWGLDPALPKQLEALLEKAVADGAFPGAVCMVARHGVNIVQLAVGRLDYAADSSKVGWETPYDLASLTKVCATTPAVLRLVADAKLSLDDPVQKWVPAFTGTGKDKVTIRHLLAHQGGLPAYERYYRTTKGKDTIVDAAAKEGLMTEPGTGVTYSDLGFILLMAVVEKCSGESFETFVQREVLRPFGMGHARFVSTELPSVPLTAAAPTEQDDARGGVVHGFVHDENAFAMGGVSGHAGLFATATDVLAFGVAMLGGGKGVIPRDLVDRATTPSGIGGDTTRGLGFEMLRPGTWAGTEVSPGAFGHTGFTGTSLWCDPRLDLCVVLLTNRVHPTRVNNKITAVRRAVHDLVRNAVR